MNKLNIGETILQLRKKKNITQEQLAIMVGVSAGAVSKWETGNSTPDILLLAPLARALNTSLDILLSFQQELSETEVADIKKELTEVFLYKGYAVGEEKCKSYLKEYPNSIYLKFTVAGMIQMYSSMSEDASEELIKIRLQDSLTLYKQVATSRETKYAPIAIYCIASIYMMLENYEESEKALKELPKITANPMDLFPTLYMKQGKKEEARKLCSSMLFQQLNQSYLMLSTLANISKDEGDYDKAFLYIDAVYKLQNIFKVGAHLAEYKYSKLSIEIHEKEEASKWFKAYVKGVLSDGYDYHDNPYFNNIELEVKPEGQKIIRKKVLQSLIDEEEFKVLTGISEYHEAINELKDAISGM
jgi:transcriptional regulator with XRE-family HTH domain